MYKSVNKGQILYLIVGCFWFTCKSWGTKNSLSLAVKFYSSPQP